MKTLIAALSFALSFAAQAQTQERHPLTYVQYDATSHYVLPEEQVASVNVIINEIDNEVSLVSLPRFSCPADRVCAMVMPAPIVLTLPIRHVGVPFCGGRIITAERNQIPVDGDRVEIQILDNRERICDDIQPKLQVTVTEERPWNGGTSVSTFEVR